MTEFYRRPDGKWIVRSIPEVEFDNEYSAQWYALTGETLTAAEAASALGGYMKKEETAKAIIRAVQSLATVNDLGPDLVKEYFDAGAFADGDVAAIGITAAQLGACITLLQQVGLLMGSGATTPADYTATLNAVRRVT